MHPHNAWFYLMYVGGASFMLPMICLTIYSSYCGYKMWKVKSLLPGNPLVYSILVMLLIAMYVKVCLTKLCTGQHILGPICMLSWLHGSLQCGAIFVMVVLRGHYSMTQKRMNFMNQKIMNWKTSVIMKILYQLKVIEKQYGLHLPRSCFESIKHQLAKQYAIP